MFTKTPRKLIIELVGIFIGSIITLFFLNIEQSLGLLATTTIGYFIGVYNNEANK